MRRWAALLFAALSLGASRPAPPVDLAALLAETPAPRLDAYGLFTDPGARAPHPALTPYGLNTPLFSDFAEKSRFVFLPPGTKATYAPTGAFVFPVGATLVKTFAYPADLRAPTARLRFIETRLLIRKTQGWVALTYVWNDEQTQAVLKRGGVRLPVSVIDRGSKPLTIDYAVPNANQCKECHSLAGELSPIGPSARNLNGDLTYPAGRENQLAHWTRAGLLGGAPAPQAAPRTAVWTDTKAPLRDRARAYLDANCGHCHNPLGMASNSGLFLNLEEEDPAKQGVWRRPVAAGRGSGGLEYDIDPGRPETSILLHRMNSVEPGVMMPELGRSLVDQDGVALVRDYLRSLPASR